MLSLAHSTTGVTPCELPPVTARIVGAVAAATATAAALIFGDGDSVVAAGPGALQAVREFKGLLSKAKASPGLAMYPESPEELRRTQRSLRQLRST